LFVPFLCFASQSFILCVTIRNYAFAIQWSSNSFNSAQLSYYHSNLLTQIISVEVYNLQFVITKFLS
jgi:hypothetical protein